MCPTGCQASHYGRSYYKAPKTLRISSHLLSPQTKPHCSPLPSVTYGNCNCLTCLLLINYSRFVVVIQDSGGRRRALCSLLHTHCVSLVLFKECKVEEIYTANSKHVFNTATANMSSTPQTANMSSTLQTANLSSTLQMGGRRSPAVACWASDHWVASSNPLRGKFRH